MQKHLKINTIMKKLLTIVLSILSLTLIAQETKKVAILETVDKEGKVPYGVKFQVRSSLTFAINRTEGYEGLDRVDMAQITGEQTFQRTGMVSDAQIKQLGEMTGAQYVLIAEAAEYDENNVIIAAKMLDVETGSVANSAPPVVANKDPEQMQTACNKVADLLMGGDIKRQKAQEEQRRAEALAQQKAKEEEEARAQEAQRIQQQQELQEQLHENLENLGNAIANLAVSSNSYTLIVNNYQKHPYKIILAGHLLGIVQPYKTESFKIPVEWYGKFQAVQTQGYIFSPTVLNGTVPPQQKRATFTMHLKSK